MSRIASRQIQIGNKRVLWTIRPLPQVRYIAHVTLITSSLVRPHCRGRKAEAPGRSGCNETHLFFSCCALSALTLFPVRWDCGHDEEDTVRKGEIR